MMLYFSLASTVIAFKIILNVWGFLASELDGVK